MPKELLRWLLALVLGAAGAAITWLGSHIGTPGGVDPLIAGVLVAVLKRIVDYIGSKLPVTPPAPPPSASRSRPGGF